MSSFEQNIHPSEHSALTHYCAVDSFEKIIQNRTLKCTNLSSMQLNDKFEAKRRKIEYEARRFFIACFSHSEHEIVPFWKNYGGDCLCGKLALKFKNFCTPPTTYDDYPEKFFPHYCLESECKKVELNPNEFFATDSEKSAHDDIIKLLKYKGVLADYRVGLLFEDVKYVEKDKIEDMENITSFHFPEERILLATDTRIFGKLKPNLGHTKLRRG